MKYLEMIETIDMRIRVRHPKLGVLVLSAMITGEAFRDPYLDVFRNQIDKEIDKAIKARALEVD
jgi:hypothetical protein